MEGWREEGWVKNLAEKSCVNWDQTNYNKVYQSQKEPIVYSEAQCHLNALMQGHIGLFPLLFYGVIPMHWCKIPSLNNGIQEPSTALSFVVCIPLLIIEAPPRRDSYLHPADTETEAQTKKLA